MSDSAPRLKTIFWVLFSKRSISGSATSAVHNRGTMPPLASSWMRDAMDLASATSMLKVRFSRVCCRNMIHTKIIISSINKYPNMEEAIVLMIACVSCVGVAMMIAIMWLLVERNSEESSTDDSDGDGGDGGITYITDAKDLNEDDRYVIGREGQWLTMDYDGSRPKGKQCDVKDDMTGLDTANDFQFTKSSTNWIIATDYDEDGKYTSYLSNKASDLIQARDKEKAEKTQRWTIDCNDDGCKVRNPETKKYLNLSGKRPTLSSSGTRVRIAKT